MRNLILCKNFLVNLKGTLKPTLMTLSKKLDISRNKLDQYTMRNNIEIQEIYATVSDDHLEHKLLNICKSMNLTVENSDIGGYH